MQETCKICEKQNTTFFSVFPKFDSLGIKRVLNSIACMLLFHSGTKNQKVPGNILRKRPTSTRLSVNSKFAKFLYSDDGLHCKYNKTPHKMTYGLVSVQGWPLNTGKNNKERQTCGRLKQVTNTAFV